MLEKLPRSETNNLDLNEISRETLRQIYIYSVSEGSPYDHIEKIQEKIIYFIFMHTSVPLIGIM